MSKHPSTSTRNTSDRAQHHTTIRPNIGRIRHVRRDRTSIKTIGKIPIRSQRRRVLTKRGLHQVKGTFRRTSSPRRSTINPRQHWKPAMPEETPGPMSLVLSHEIVKLRIFTNLNKRRKGTFPKKMTIILRSTTKPTRDRLAFNLAQQKTIPSTSNQNTTQQTFITIPDMRRVKKLQRTTNIQQGATPKTLTATKISCSLVLQASRIAARKC